MCHPKIAEAILLVREADDELICSNFDQAKEGYQKAGDCLTSLADEEKLTQYDRNVTYFSAAVAYYKGGLYKNTLNVLSKVSPAIMGKDLLEQYREINKHAKERLSSSNKMTYIDVIQKSLEKARKQKANGKNCDLSTVCFWTQCVLDNPRRAR
jgi:hypothetical protein